MKTRSFSPLLVLMALFAGVRTVPAQASKATAQATAASPAAGEPHRGSSSASAAEMPIRRVVLYSNGLAFIERRGTVRGNAEIRLSFRDADLDDVLKSLLVLDSGKGKIGEVSFNIVQPPGVRLSEIPFASWTWGRSGRCGCWTDRPGRR